MVIAIYQCIQRIQLHHTARRAGSDDCVVYFLPGRLAHYGLKPGDVTAELERRAGTSGIEEKPCARPFCVTPMKARVAQPRALPSEIDNWRCSMNEVMSLVIYTLNGSPDGFALHCVKR